MDKLEGIPFTNITKVKKENENNKVLGSLEEGIKFYKKLSSRGFFMPICMVETFFC